jgi:hypothetical protein
MENKGKAKPQPDQHPLHGLRVEIVEEIIVVRCHSRIDELVVVYEN